MDAIANATASAPNSPPAPYTPSTTNGSSAYPATSQSDFSTFIIIGVIAAAAVAAFICLIVVYRRRKQSRTLDQKNVPPVFVISEHLESSNVTNGEPPVTPIVVRPIRQHMWSQSSDEVSPMSPDAEGDASPRPWRSTRDGGDQDAHGRRTPGVVGAASPVQEEERHHLKVPQRPKSREDLPPPRFFPHGAASSSQRSVQTSSKRDSGYISVEDLASQRSSLYSTSQDLPDIDEQEVYDDGSVARAPGNRHVSSSRRGGRGLGSSCSRNKPLVKPLGRTPGHDFSMEDISKSMPALNQDSSVYSSLDSFRTQSYEGISEQDESRDSHMEDSIDGRSVPDLLVSAHGSRHHSGTSVSSGGDNYMRVGSEEPLAFGESSDDRCVADLPKEGRSSQGSRSSAFSTGCQSSGSQAESITSGPSTDASFSECPSMEAEMSPVSLEGVGKKNLLGQEWHFVWEALPQGSTWHRDKSAIVLVVPPGAVRRPTAILSSVFTQFALVRHHIPVPTCQVIVTPVVELFTPEQVSFESHVQLKLPHNLPAGFDQTLLKVFCFQNDIECRLIPVQRYTDASRPPPECFFEVTGDNEVLVHTRHFSVYFCTLCDQKTNIGLTAMVFCGYADSGSAVGSSSFSYSAPEVRVGVVVLDNKHKIIDITEDVKLEEAERGLLYVDTKSLRLFSHVNGDDQLSFKCAAVGAGHWSHKTRNDSRPIFDEMQTYDLLEVVSCCQDCERQRVEWAFVAQPPPSPSSLSPTLPSPPGPPPFGGVVDVLNRRGGRAPPGQEDKQTTFLLSNILPADVKSSGGRQRRREERFGKVRRLLEKRLGDEQTLQLAKGLELASKDISNLCKGYQGQRLRARLLEMSYDRMHANVFWSRLPSLLWNIGAQDVLRDLQTQRLLPGRASPETGEEPSPTNHETPGGPYPTFSGNDELTRPKSPRRLHDNCGPRQRLPQEGPGTTTFLGRQPRENRSPATAPLREDSDLNTWQCPEFPPSPPARDDTRPKMVMHGGGGGGRLAGNPPMLGGEETQPKRGGPSGREEEGRGRGCVCGGHADNMAAPCSSSRRQEKGDPVKPYSMDTTERKEVRVGIQPGRRERMTNVGAPAAEERVLQRQRHEGESDDDTGESTYRKTVM